MQKVDISVQLGLNNYERSVGIAEKLARLGASQTIGPVYFPLIDGAISVHCAKSNATSNALADFVLVRETQGDMLVGLANFRRLDTAERPSVVGLLTETGLILPKTATMDFSTLAVRLTAHGAQELIGLSEAAGEVAFPGSDPFDVGSYARVCLDAVSKRTRQT